MIWFDLPAICVTFKTCSSPSINPSQFRGEINSVGRPDRIWNRAKFCWLSFWFQNITASTRTSSNTLSIPHFLVSVHLIFQSSMDVRLIIAILSDLMRGVFKLTWTEMHLMPTNSMIWDRCMRKHLKWINASWTVPIRCNLLWSLQRKFMNNICDASGI